MVDQNTLEATLKNQQWVGGQTPTNADQEAFEAVKDSDLKPDTHPHLFAWFCLVSKFTEPIRKSWTAAAAKGGKGGAAKGGKKGGKKEEKASEDEMDLFGDDNEDDVAAAQAAKDKIKADQAAKKKTKKVVIAQSLVMFEVKPLDDTTNLDDVAKRIFKELAMDGAFWKTEYRKEPVAFGIFKLIIGACVEDDKVSTDDIEEAITAMDDFVQSLEIVSFNKL